MTVSLPDSNEIIVTENRLITTSWFTFFQDTWKAIRGGLLLSIGGTISVDTTIAVNSGSLETDLMTFETGDNLFKNNGDELYVKAWGIYGANTNNKTVKLKFGSQTILDTSAIAANNGAWQIEASIVRTASATQEIIASIISGNGSVAESATRTAGSQDLTISNILSVTGQGTSSSDITQYAMIIKLTPNDS